MKPSRTQLAASALGCAAAACVGGCGFTPMYAAPGLASGMAQIEVVVPTGRVAYLLGEDLDDDFGHDKDATPIWRLVVTIDQSRIPLGLTVNDVAENYALGLKVHYALTEIATGKIAVAGDVASEVSYDSATQPYAGIAARQSSQERAASDAARRIQSALAQWMSRRQD
jgi:LPS-assembly lipoprotein